MSVIVASPAGKVVSKDTLEQCILANSVAAASIYSDNT